MVAIVERVIPHAELVRRLHLDRLEAEAGAGGLVQHDVAPSLVGPAETTREVCYVHGWVGRFRFEQDNHIGCDPTDHVDPCPTCKGERITRSGSNFCKDCSGSGVRTVKPKEFSRPISAIVDMVRETAPHTKVNGKRYREKRSRPRALTIPVRKITRADRMRYADEVADVVMPPRPKVRADCVDAVRPCPWVGCRHHLYLETNAETGSIKLVFPDLEPWELEHSCSLDAAENGAHTLDPLSARLNVSRERARQLEVTALHQLTAKMTPDGEARPDIEE